MKMKYHAPRFSALILTLSLTPMVLLAQPFLHHANPVPSGETACEAQVQAFGLLTPHRLALSALRTLYSEAYYAAGGTKAHIDPSVPPTPVALGNQTSSGIVSSWRDMAARLQHLTSALEWDVSAGTAAIPNLPGSEGVQARVVVLSDPLSIVAHLKNTLAIAENGEKIDPSSQRDPVRLRLKGLLIGSTVGLALAGTFPFFVENIGDMWSHLSTWYQQSLGTAVAGSLGGFGVDLFRYFRAVRLAADDIPFELQGKLRFEEVVHYLEHHQFVQDHRVYLGLNNSKTTDKGQYLDTYFFAYKMRPYLVTIEWKRF